MPPSTPQGHGFAVAAIGIPGRKPWGKTQLARDLGAHSPPSEISVSLAEIAQARKVVESKESEFENQGRIVGVCKVRMEWVAVEWGDVAV